MIQKMSAIASSGEWETSTKKGNPTSQPKSNTIMDKRLVERVGLEVTGADVTTGRTRSWNLRARIRLTQLEVHMLNLEARVKHNQTGNQRLN
jgi:hypothetical protein